MPRRGETTMGALGSHERFVKDMKVAGYEVDEEYAGRGYYHGSAVRIDRDEEQDIIRATNIRLCFDNMGRDKLIVYPK